MFDGNHRVRRDVNLSGRRRPRPGIVAASSTSSATATAGPKLNFLKTAGVVEDAKTTVLEQSRLQREERRMLQLQQSSARKIQRVTRGWLTRKMLMRLWIHQCQQQQTSGAEDVSSTNNAYVSLFVLQLSMLLSLTRDYGHSLLTLEQKLPLLEHETVSSVSKQRILQNALLDLRDDNDDPALSHLIQYFVEQDPNPIDMRTYVVLVETCQLWMRLHQEHPVTQKLWQWSCQAAATIHNRRSLAYLGATCFGYADRDHQAVPATFFAAPDTNRWNYQVLLHAFMEILVTEDQSLHRMLRDREAQLVCRAMELYQTLQNPNPHILLQLLESLLSKQNHATILTSLKIRGENIRSMLLIEGNGVDHDFKETTGAGSTTNADDDEEEEDEGDSAPPPAVTNKRRHRQITATRLTRQQVQTVPRLNQTYQDQLSRIRKETLTYVAAQDLAFRTNAVELAEQLGQAALWQQWGISVLGQDSESASRIAYVRLLGRLLQGCSGFKTSTASPFLSQLAYSKPFLEALWRQTLVLLINGTDDEELTLVCTTIFCDVFAHHLISLSDKDFLQYYTTANSNPTILVEHVVINLKTLLHDLYWNKPVLATHVVISQDIPCLRARLFLSATKLWNSLYERWSRLVHQAPFCDESTWWFPRLASRDDDSAVIGSRENPDAVDDDDAMDIDDSDIEVDENDLENDALADTFRDPKMARVLTSIPQAIPFDRRVKLFNSLLNADKLRTQDDSAFFHSAMARMTQRGGDNDDMMDLMGGRERVEIHRDQLYSDSMNQLNKLGRRLKSKIQVTMINKHGNREAGIDGGGVFKEFLDDLITEAFDPQAEGDTPTLFSVTEQETLAVNMELVPTQDILAHYEFLGRVLGKSMYESVLVEPQFCLPFLNQLLGKQNSLEDLKNFDLEFYNNLMKLRTLSEHDIIGMGLTFELNVSNSRTVSLIPNGSRVSVTKQNVFHYIHLVAHQRLNIEGALQTRAFLRGFRDLIPASWVRLFSAYELQKMISGDDSVRGIDVANLREAMQYAGGYHPSQPIILWFWEVIEQLTSDQQRQFLRFMTSCSRQPLLGFRALEPLPCIQQVRVLEGTSPNEVPLPSSSTCMNLLKLPNYGTKALLHKKLIAAIEAGAGFELS